MARELSDEPPTLEETMAAQARLRAKMGLPPERTSKRPEGCLGWFGGLFLLVLGIMALLGGWGFWIVHIL